jgi:AcrR family transcriptional regulator
VLEEDVVEHLDHLGVGQVALQQAAAGQRAGVQLRDMPVALRVVVPGVQDRLNPGSRYGIPAAVTVVISLVCHAVLILRTCTLYIFTCTAYSCQVMDANPQPDGEDGGRARLSKRVVVDRALKLADTEGLDALTIRKLAQDLGVTPMALYWHFRSKEDLLEGVAERIWSEIEVNVDPSVPWWAQLQGGLESLLRALRAHPSAPALVLEHEKRNEAALRATEGALEILLSAGFDAQHAAEIARSTLWTGITLVMSEAGYHPELSAQERAEFHRRNEMADCDPDFHYRLGVEMFIAGVRAMAERYGGAAAGS